QRGMQLSVPDRFRPTASFQVRVCLLRHSPIPLKKHTRVRVHHGTSELLGSLNPIGSQDIHPGQTCFAQIVCHTPILAIPGDAFILRRISPMITIGGGIVLNTSVKGISERNTDETIEFLKVLESGSLKERILGLAGKSLATGVTEGQIMSQTL